MASPVIEIAVCFAVGRWRYPKEQQLCQCETNERIKNARIPLRRNNGGVLEKVKRCFACLREKGGGPFVKRLRSEKTGDVTLRRERNVTSIA